MLIFRQTKNLCYTLPHSLPLCMRIQRWSSVFFLYTLGSIPKALAQDSITTAPVLIQAPRFASRELLSAQHLDGQTLESMRHLPVADALRHFSGVQLKDYGGVGGLKTINVRGMGTQHVGVFYDGIALNNAQNGQIDLGRFSLEDMEALTLHTGHRMRLLQPAKDFASATALYLETRHPQWSEQRWQSLRTRLHYGSFDTGQFSLTYARSLSSLSTVTLSTEALTTSGRYPFRYRTVGGYDTTAVRENGDVRSFRSEATFFYRLPKGIWRTKLYGYTSERGLPGAVVRNRLVHEDRQWDTQVFLQSSLRYRYSSAATLLLNAKWGYDYLRYLSQPSAKDPHAIYTHNTYRRSESYLSVAQEFTVSPTLALSMATDYAYDHVHANLHAFGFPTRHSLYAATALRYQWGILELQPSLLYVATKEHVRSGTAAPARRHWSPTLTATLPLPWVEGLMLQAFYKDVFRLPTLNETYYTFVGKADLLPEVARQWNFSVHYSLPRWTFKAEVYHSRVNDKIVAIPTSNMFRWTMMNLGKVHLMGAEVAATYEHRWKELQLRLRSTYTYERAVDRTSPDTPFYGHQIPYIPRHSGSLLSALSWRQWQLLYSFIYTGDRYDQKTNEAANFAPAWYTSDVSLSYERAAWQVGLQVLNLFNQSFEIVKGYPLPGTHFRLSLRLHL